MTKVICDLCGKEAAVDLNRVPIVLESGKRILVSVRIEVDEGGKDAAKADICRVCLRLAAKAYTLIN